MREALGLSIGVANLVAARNGSAPLARRSVLTLFGHRLPEVGVPDENPNLTEPGLVLHGFIAGIGGPAPFVAPDGSAHRSETLTAEALDAMARAVGYGASTAIAVPGHWGQNTVAALREALRSKPSLGPGGGPMLVSDATAALAALYSKPGFPTDGVVVLCDFGAGGTDVTLTDAGANFRHIGDTVRYADFSGDQIDQAILHRTKSAFADADTSHTTPVGSLSARLDECRRAKEQLSSATVTVVPAEMPGVGEDVRLFRTELESLISDPLDRFVDFVEDMLRRNAIAAAKLAGVATVGGGACIPLVTQRLEQRLSAPVVTTPHPMHSAAIGAATFAEQHMSASATASAGSAPTIGTPAPTDLEPAGWAADAAVAAAGESAEDGSRSATFRALAWSEDDATGDEPLAGEPLADAPDDDVSAAPPQAVTAEPGDALAPAAAPPRKGWRVLLGVAALVALAVLAGVGVLVLKPSTTDTPTRTTSHLPTPSRLPSVGSLPPPPVTETTVTTVTETTRVPTTTTRVPTTTTWIPTTTTPPTTTWQTTQSTITSTYPPTYPSPTTMPPASTTILVPPRLVPVTPTYPR